MWIYSVWVSKVVHQPAQRGAKGPSHNVTPQWVPLASAGAGHCLLQKWWAVVLKCWGEIGNPFPNFRASFFSQVDVLKDLFFLWGKAMLCSRLLSQLSSAEAWEQEAPWNPQSSTAPQSICQPMAEADGFIRWSKRSAGENLTGSVSKGTGGLNCLWLQLPNFMSASPSVRVTLLLSFIRHFAV